jgi:serine/threonine-protein kinase ATR
VYSDEKIYFLLGNYYDRMLRANSDIKEEKSNTNNVFKTKQSTGSCSKFLSVILQHFGKAATYGHQYIFQTLPRMLTLWFEHGNYWEYKKLLPSTTKRIYTDLSSKPQTFHNIHEQYIACHQNMIQFTQDIAEHQWLTSLPQIISRLCHTNENIFEFIKIIITNVFIKYPQQSLWLLASVLKSIDKNRAAKAKEIFQYIEKQLSQKNDQRTKILMNEANKLFEELIKICSYINNKKKIDTMSISSTFKLLNKINFQTLIIPIQSSLTVTLPTSNMSADSIRDYNAFSTHLVTIQQFNDTIEILKSKEKPKKLTILGSDGHTYAFLCKKEVKGDMRKNSRMMEFNTVVNRLLKVHKYIINFIIIVFFIYFYYFIILFSYPMYVCFVYFCV